MPPLFPPATLPPARRKTTPPGAAAAGSLPSRSGTMRFSAKTRSWEKAEQQARKYEIAATTGEEVERTSSLPTVKEAVNAYLADAEARGLADGTMERLRQAFKKRLAVVADQHRIAFFREFNLRSLTEWRSASNYLALSYTEQFQRV